MDRITDKIAALPPSATYVSLEFFPPKTQIGFANLQTRLERMSNALRPLFVNVTWGAGGCTSSRSLELAEICQRQLRLTTCLHLTCTNMKRRVVDEALEEAKVLGIRNILALRGDPPRDEEYRLEDEEVEKQEDSNEDFTWAIDLVRYIRRIHGDYFCIGVAGYPEGHADQSHPTEQNTLHDLPYLIEKTKAGADFIMTQLFYDLDAYTKYEKLLRDHESGVFATIPIIPGLMPLQSYEILVRSTKLAHVKVPPELLQKVQRVKGDDEAVKQVGVEAMSEIVDGIKGIKQKGPRGFHFYTLNLEKAVSALLERCDLIPPESGESNNSAIDDISIMTNGTSAINGANSSHRTLSTTSSLAAAELTANPHRSSSSPRLPAFPHNSNPLSREATWDDYPNGRFGDPRSPAFNPPLTYSPTSLTVSPIQALELWATPTTNAEITHLFTSHLSGSAPKQLPWSESATLSPETALITLELTALTLEKGYWTIASQPAVDGLASTHAIHGWGPPGGFVFQKAFVEFFVPSATFTERLLPRLNALHKEGEISYYACKSDGSFLSSESSEAVHAVTWGSFAGKEIATATMVEEVSFRAWVEEAFGIWGEWGRCVGEAGRRGGVQRARDSRAFLRRVERDVWLVNIIGHGYREAGRLWELLREG